MGDNNSQEQWEQDCREWWGRVLDGTRQHWCPCWDDMPIDDTCGKALNCRCYDGTPQQRTTAEVVAIEALDAARCAGAADAPPF